MDSLTRLHGLALLYSLWFTFKPETHRETACLLTTGVKRTLTDNNTLCKHSRERSLISPLYTCLCRVHRLLPHQRHLSGSVTAYLSTLVSECHKPAYLCMTHALAYILIATRVTSSTYLQRYLIFLGAHASPPLPSITLFYCQITPIDSERSEVMVSTVCGQEPMKRPNHTSAIMESSASLNDGIERYWKSKQRIHWLLSALRLSHLLRRGSVEAETALEQGRETDLISVQDLHVWPIKSAEVRGHQ